MTKSELQKLIKKGGTIYVVEYYDYPPYSDIDEYDLTEYTLEFPIDKPGLVSFIDKDPEFCPNCLDIEIAQCYTSKEDAEFERDFKDIRRTEVLNLPTWEEIQKKRYDITFRIKDDIITFTNQWYEGYNIEMNSDPLRNELTKWYMTVEGDYKCYFDKLMSKENYLEACKVAKELFLKGENDE